MKIRISTIAALIIFAASWTEATAQISLSPLFTDNMVLQQKTEAPVWGTAAPGSEVTVVTSWNKAQYTATAAEDGKWSVKVRTPKAGGPYTMTLTENGQNPIQISNILIGEVWLCSGQSNMQMPIGGTWGWIQNYEQEIKDAAKYPQIRLMTVQMITSSHPEDNFPAVDGGWLVCSPESVDEFSATAYFFGREIHLKRNVPVGLIHSAWGGTTIEAWTSREALAGVKDLEDEAEMVAGWPEDRETRRAMSQPAIKAWNQLIPAYDEVMKHEEEFAEVGFDDSAWDDMALPGRLETIYPKFDGHVLVRRSIDIPASWEGKQITLNMIGVDDNDVTYFNGLKIGETKGFHIPRQYFIPTEAVKSGKATVAIRIMDNSGDGGVNGQDPTFYLEGPEGDKVSLAGTWKSTKAADYSTLPPKPKNMYSDPGWSTVLYNAMINPLIPYAIKGAIWYQGCSNEDRAYQYRDLMKIMIHDWRERWGYDFPFYITQLANYRIRQTMPENSAWAEIREAQDMADRTVPNTGMAVTIDIGDAYDIHPKNKQEVGRRLALQAMNKTYNMPVECSGPVYERYEVDGNVIRLHFSSTAKGLVAKGGKLEGFAIAGADRVFHWGEAKIVGNCIEVSCDEVPRPLAVRYAWADNPLGNLYNTTGLPASPFRTDDWPGVTFGKTSR